MLSSRYPLRRQFIRKLSYLWISCCGFSLTQYDLGRLETNGVASFTMRLYIKVTIQQKQYHCTLAPVWKPCARRVRDATYAFLFDSNTSFTGSSPPFSQVKLKRPQLSPANFMRARNLPSMHLLQKRTLSRCLSARAFGISFG